MIIDNLFTRPIFESQMDPITQFASNAHEEWRRNFDPTGTKPRVKKNSDGTEGDINVPFEKLHPDWKKENLAAAHAAHHAVKHFGRDMEKAAEHVHNEWMKRNPKGDWNAAQHVPYDDLPEDEKEKDRVHVRTMQQLMGQQPEQNIAEASAANDYFTRRKSEEDRIAGVKAPAKNKKNPANTDYAKKRKQQDVTEAGHDHRRRAAASHNDEECSLCDGTGEGRHEGQSCGACGGSGVARGQYDHDDFDIPDKDDMYEGVAEGSEEKDPVWNKGTPMTKDYTCHCGLYVHPSRRNPKAIHTSDCPYAKKQDKEQGVAEALTYPQKHSSWSVRSPKKNEFNTRYKLDQEPEARAHAERIGGKLVKVDQRGHDIRTGSKGDKGVAEGEVVQFPKKHPYELLTKCPECGGPLQGGKDEKGRLKLCMPCMNIYRAPNQQGVAEGAPELLKKEMPLHRHAEKLLDQNGVS